MEDGDSGADKHPHRIGYFDWRDELHVSSYELILNDNLDRSTFGRLQSKNF